MAQLQSLAQLTAQPVLRASCSLDLGHLRAPRVLLGLGESRGEEISFKGGVDSGVWLQSHSGEAGTSTEEKGAEPL